MEWHWHPEIVFGLVLLGWAYWAGVGPLRSRYRWAERIERRRVGLFLVGFLLLAIAEISPVHDLSERWFSIHMVQHVLLAFVVVPLFLMATPDWLVRPLLRWLLVRRLARLLTHPLIAFALFNVTFALWHLPVLYDAAVRNDAVHAAEHITFLVTGVLMWWPLLSPLPELPRLSSPAQMLYLFLLPIAQIVVFAPITFSQTVLYSTYAAEPRLGAISALADQQIGGATMKVATTVIFLLALTIVFFRWFNREEGLARANDGPSEGHGFGDSDPEPVDLEPLARAGR